MVQWNVGFRGGKKPPGGASHFLMQKEDNSAKEISIRDTLNSLGSLKALSHLPQI